MRILVQRVTRAAVIIEGEEYSRIGKGLLVLLGITEGDSQQDIDWLVKKLVGLRVFDDAAGVMNLSVAQIDGQIMVVSQFTLYASTRKGNRPSYIRAATEEIAVPLYQAFIDTLSGVSGSPIATGRFGADMQLELVNDGPVTIAIDSRNRE